MFRAAGISGDMSMTRASRLMCMTAVATFALAIYGASAIARTVYFVQAGNWYVTALTNSCLAFNRAPNEYNQSPFNSLTIHAPKAGGFLFEVAFWPKSFTAGSRHSLSLRAEGRSFYEIDADAVSDHTLKSRAPVPDELVKGLRTANMVTAGTRDVPVSLAFDRTLVDDILLHLDSCRRLIAEN